MFDVAQTRYTPLPTLALSFLPVTGKLMEAFQYQALDPEGREVSGVVQADTARQVRGQLRAQGLLPSRVDKVGAREKPVRPGRGACLRAESRTGTGTPCPKGLYLNSDYL